MDYKSRITLEPVKRSGKPCIRRMRITVQDVSGHLAAGITPEQIFGDFSYLEREDILACLAYAADTEKHSMLARWMKLLFDQNLSPSPVTDSVGTGFRPI